MADTTKTLAEGGPTALDEEAVASRAKIDQESSVPAPNAVSSQIAQGSSQADITNEDLFPGMNQKINVGSSTSQTLGTQPIFVAAGQYVPYNILNKKEEAIAAAAKKRAERQAKFKPGKAKELKNQLYQRDLNNQVNTMHSDFIRTAQTMDPDNWDVMLNDPGSEIGRLYAQQKSNFDVLATESDVLFEKTAQVVSDMETGGPTLYSQASKDLAYAVKNRSGKAIEGKSLEDLRPLVDEFNGSYDLDNHLATNNVVNQMKADITSLMTPEHGGFTTEEEHDWSKRIEAYAESETATKAGRYFNDNLIKKQDIVDRLSSMLGLQQTTTHKRGEKLTTYDKKQGKEKEDAQDRFEKVEYIRENPYSEEAITALGGMQGNEWGKGKITEIGYSHPEDFTKYDDEAKKVLNVFEDAKDKKTGAAFTWNQSQIQTKGKEAVIAALKELGKGSNSIGSVKKGTGSNIIIETGTEKVTIDLGSADKGKEVLSDFFIKYGNERQAVGTRDASKVRVVTLDGKRKTIEYVDLKDPRLFKLTNASLNTGKAENLKIKQKDIDKLLKEKREKEKKTTAAAATPAKKVSYEEYEKTDDYKSVLAQAKLDFPNNTEAEIIKSIKGKY